MSASPTELILSQTSKDCIIRHELVTAIGVRPSG